jgi:hypothetical protein
LSKAKAAPWRTGVSRTLVSEIHEGVVAGRKLASKWSLPKGCPETLHPGTEERAFAKSHRSFLMKTEPPAKPKRPERFLP